MIFNDDSNHDNDEDKGGIIITMKMILVTISMVKVLLLGVFITNDNDA